MRRKKVCLFVYVFIFICLLFSGCSASQVSEANNRDLKSEIIRIGLGTSTIVRFDPQENKEIQSNFVLVPEHGKIRIKYVEGNWKGVDVQLYNKIESEIIMEGILDKEGDSIVFNNLVSSNEYYFVLLFDCKQNNNTSPETFVCQISG